MIKRSLLVAGTVATIGLAAAGAGVASAATTTTDKDTIVSKIAQKFNLSQEDVQKVFDEERSARQAEMQVKNEERLAQAVTDKKITEEQKQKIIAKQAELQKEREANKDTMKDKTEAERKTAMEQKRTELEKWATENGIPKEYLRMGGGHGHGGPRQ